MRIARLRNSQDWNTGLFKALSLADGPFKLYVWLRLNVRPETGAIEINQLDLARALNKTRSTIRKELRTLAQAGVCQLRFQRGPAAVGRIVITDDYWPYQRNGPEANDPDFLRYLDRIRAILAERACIRRSFSEADRLLSRQWHTRGVPVSRIECAVLLGCARKYASWKNGRPPIPIGSLIYFEPILDEVEHLQIPQDYWDYLRWRIEPLDKLWLQAGKTGAQEEPSA